MSQHSTDRPGSTDPGNHPQQRRGQLPPYKVILLSTTLLDMMFVVRTVMELTRLCREEATFKMWESRNSGRAALLTTYKERAELYAEQFADRGLTVTIEAV